MNTSMIFRGLLLIAAIIAAVPVAATTTVTFIKPAEYTDIGYYGLDSADAMKVLEQHFKALSDRYIAPNQNLTIDVLDVDLAGRVDYARSWRFYDRRVLRGTADWPRMKFHYVLEADGTVLTDAEADIADMNYFHRIGNYHPNVSYPYEKRLLEDWFKATFSGSQAKRQ
ncbi:MAG: DUF3016 domain-containing protein [Burkholderiales bacterium]